MIQEKALTMESIKLNNNEYQEQIINATKKLYNTVESSTFILEFRKKEENMGNAFFLDYHSILMFLAQSKEYLTDESNWDEVVYSYMDQIRTIIQSKPEEMGTGFFNGLTAYGFSVKMIAEKTGSYHKFLMSLNKLVVNEAKKILKEAKNNIEKTRMEFFDTIIGLSGTARYLLLFKDHSMEKEALFDILNYFILLTHDKSFDGLNVPSYHIPSENHFLESEKELFKNGSFNFGLSHGMGGPLVVLSLALNEGIEMDGHREAISKLLRDVYRFSFEIDSAIYWSGSVSFDEYISGDIEKVPNRASWCYGTPGIARAVYIAAKAIDDKEMIAYALRSLEGLCQMPIQQYFLDSPTICHGYSGVWAVLNLMYKETNNPLFYQRMNEIVELILNKYDEKNAFGFRDIYAHKNSDGSFERDLLEKDKICLLEGATGILLCLLTYLNQDQNDWMQNLLIL